MELQEPRSREASLLAYLAEAHRWVGDVVDAAHSTIERVGAVAWLPFLAEEEAWLAKVAQ